MSGSLGAVGANAKFYWKEETAEGVAPSGDWDQFPAFALTIGTAPGLRTDSVLSANARRNAADPFFGVADVAGSARVPIETMHIGRWFKMLLGAPATTNAAAVYTHVFKSGGLALPSRSIEKAFTDIGRFEVASGVYANTLEVSVDPDNGSQATIGLMCRSEARSGTSGAGTPAVATGIRLNSVQGAISRNGAPLAGVTGGAIRFGNGMSPVPTVGSGTGIGGIDLGEATGGGNVNLRFANDSFRAAALAGTYSSLTYALAYDADNLIEFHFPRIRLAPLTTPVEGPGGIAQNFTFTASDDAADASLLRVTLRNGVAAY